MKPSMFDGKSPTIYSKTSGGLSIWISHYKENSEPNIFGKITINGKSPWIKHHLTVQSSPANHHCFLSEAKINRPHGQPIPLMKFGESCERCPQAVVNRGSLQITVATIETVYYSPYISLMSH